jgi:hypothetical protein
MRLIVALAALLCSTLASAIAITPDYSDVWWNPSESGWGANIIQQDDTIFVTLFVYDSNGRPTWFVGPDTSYGGTVGGAQHFTGALYSVTGPYFGNLQFNAAGVNAVQVGSVTFDASTPFAGTLSYSVNGVNVTKSVQRQTLRTDNIAGTYRGATIGAYTHCPGTTLVDFPTTLTIVQTGPSVTINEFGPGYTCRYTGVLTQAGKLASILGTGTCSDGSFQNFSASNVQAGQDFVSMAFAADVSTCRFNGRMGGMREP